MDQFGTMKIKYIGPLEMPLPLKGIAEEVLMALLSLGLAPREAEDAVRLAEDWFRFELNYAQLREVQTLVAPEYEPLFQRAMRFATKPSALAAGRVFSGYRYPSINPRLYHPSEIWGEFDPDASEPINVSGEGEQQIWIFRRRCYRVEDAGLVLPDEIALRVKHAAYKQEKALEKVQKEVAAFENFERLPSARRERIPESVRLFVWQRDRGRCVKCESNERLEFDHIIPVVEGGSSTERNVQLLCENCNRIKGKAI